MSASAQLTAARALTSETPLRDDELAEFLAYCEETPPGPWEARHASVYADPGLICWIPTGRPWLALAQFVAGARTMVPRLIAEVRHLRRRVWELEDALRPFAGVEVWKEIRDNEPWQVEVRASDLRRARELLRSRPRQRPYTSGEQRRQQS